MRARNADKLPVSVSQVSLNFAQQLSDWGMINAQQRNKSREEYSCLCGSNRITMLQPFEKNVTRNTLACCCKPGQFDQSPCPCGSCDTFIQELQAMGHKDTTINWAFTSKDTVARDLDYVDEFNPAAPPTGPVSWIRPDDQTWRPYRCRKCNFIIYAVHKLDPTVLAIVTNNILLLDQ